MSSTHAAAALQVIQNSLQTPQTSLTTVRNTLKSQYETVYAVQTPTSASSTHVNPSRLLSHHKALQKTIPTTRDALLSLQNEKHDLATTCLTTLAESRHAAAAFLPVSLPELDVTLDVSDVVSDGGELGRELERSRARLAKVVEQVSKGHRRFIENERMEGFDAKQLDIALLHAAMQTRKNENAGYEMTEESVEVSRRESGGEKKGEVDENKIPKVGTGGEGKGKSRGNAGHTVAVHEFKAVEKSAYNRLPRNLKLKAGKLSDVNDVYERVYGALREAGGGLSDKEMMDAAGLKEMSRIDVLRGLSVITKGRDGWKVFERSSGRGGRGSLRERN